MWQVALTYIGALVGAGFASGQELVTFFVAFGRKGFVGIGVVTLLFAVSGLMVIKLREKYHCHSSEQLQHLLFPAQLAVLMACLLNMALWLGLVIMIIGCCTLLDQLLSVPKWLSFALVILMVYLPLAKSGEGFLAANQYLVPLLIGIAMVICLLFLSQPLPCVALARSHTLLPHWSVSAVVYWLYNMLLAMVVLVSLKPVKGLKKGVVMGAFFLGFLAFMISLCLWLAPEFIRKGQMPMLDLAFMMNQGAGWCYALVMIIAMYTTALANCYGLVVNYEGRFKRRSGLLLMILLPAMIFIPFDFAFLVGIIYPILGYLGIPMMLALIIKALTGRG